MAPVRDRLSELIGSGPVAIKERTTKVEFRLKVETGEQRMVRYSERKREDGSIGYIGLEIDLGGNLQGTIFKERGGNSVSAVFTRERDKSLPFGKSLGDSIRETYSPEIVQSFAEYLNREGHSFARILWEEALTVTSKKK
jgi:hypothetical protein